MTLRLRCARSLKSRLTLFSLGIFLLGVWSLTLLAGGMLRDDVQSLLAAQQYAAVRLIAQGTGNELEARLKALELIAAQAAALLPAHPASLQALLEQRPVLHSLFNAGTFVVRPDGRAIASLPRPGARPAPDELDRDFAAAALREGQAHIGQSVRGGTLHAPIVTMVVPIRQAAGKIVGALAGIIDLHRPNFLDKLIGGPYGQGAGYLIVDARHRVVVHASDRRAVRDPFPAPGASALIDRFAAGYDGSGVFVDANGVEMLASAAHVPVAGWYVAAQLSTAEIFAPVKRMQQRLLLMAVALTLAAGALIGWVSQRLLRRQLDPVLAATRALTRSAQDAGAFPRPLRVRSRDEIGELIGSFNRLLDTLAQRHTLLQQVLDTASVAIFVTGQDGRIILANQRMAEMFGLALTALMGRDYMSLIHPDERALAQENFQSVLTGERDGVELERLYQRGDGRPFWGHLTSRRCTDAGGRKHGVVSVIVDVTDRRQAEERLRRSEARYRGLIADLPLGCMITQNGDVRHVNPALQAMIGYGADELLGRSFLPFIAEADRPHMDELHQRRMRGDAVEPSYVVGVIRKDGAIRQWQVFVNTIDWNGRPASLGSYVDITERRQMEEQIRQLAFYDALTHLPNRRLLDDRLAQAMAASQRSGCHGALLFLDLDNFKPLNDRHGHDVGDLLLAQAATRLKQCVRASDTVARFGGDEFVIVLAELEPDRAPSVVQARRVADKILQALSAPFHLVVRRDGQPDEHIAHQCGCSIGIALFLGQAAGPAEVIIAADTAMYRAKEAGGHTIRLHEGGRIRPGRAPESRRP